MSQISETRDFVLTKNKQKLKILDFLILLILVSSSELPVSDKFTQRLVKKFSMIQPTGRDISPLTPNDRAQSLAHRGVVVVGEMLRGAG